MKYSTWRPGAIDRTHREARCKICYGVGVKNSASRSTTTVSHRCDGGAGG